MTKITINTQFQKALNLLENTDKHLFITGKAGTGKSTLLKHFRETTKKDIAVIAPTGVAALNVQGQTIHSFFGFRPDTTLESIKKTRKKIFKQLDMIVIDEISMVRADLMDFIDRFLRLNAKHKDVPFGGVQIVCIGDLYQLPPIVNGVDGVVFRSQYASPYFFSAKVFDDVDLEYVELDTVYRQKDTDFVKLLSALRDNTFTDQNLDTLNKRVGKDTREHREEFSITLTTTNILARETNISELENLSGKAYEYPAEIGGKFEDKILPTEKVLTLKKGAQVMFLNNDTQKRWVNGTIGRIAKIKKSKLESGEDEIIVQLMDGEKVSVGPFTWEMYQFLYDEGDKKVVADTVGYFRQYPLMLAWAVTIHKSQGKTFDRVVIDVGSGAFAHGQMYVALSRSTSLEGVTLKRPLSRRDVFIDRSVLGFSQKLRQKQQEAFFVKKRCIEEAIEKKASLCVQYRCNKGEESEKILLPERLGNIAYQGKKFIGLIAQDRKAKKRSVYALENIVSVEMREEG